MPLTESFLNSTAKNLKDLLDMLPLISEDNRPYYLNLKAADYRDDDDFY